MILNKPCPMCGLTRGIGSIVWGRFSEAFNYNILSFSFFSMFLLEIAFRLYVIFSRPGAEKLRTIKAYDAKTHIVLIALYLVYAAYFHITGL